MQVDALRDREAWGVGIDHEGADAAGGDGAVRARLRGAGAREHAVEVGDAAVGDPGLLAVQHVLVAVAARAALQWRRHPSRRQARTARTRPPPSPLPPAAGSAAAAPREPASEMAPLPRPCMAKAKSARPSCQASVSRISASARTSKRCRRRRTAAVRHAVARPARLPERHAPASRQRCIHRRRGLRAGGARPAKRCAAQASRRCASSRCSGAKNGHSR